MCDGDFPKQRSPLRRFAALSFRHRRLAPNRNIPPWNYWETIADNLSKAGWSYGYVSALDRKGRTIWIVDAHGYGKRFIVRADEKLTAFLELQSAIHTFAVRLIS
jgi:hypothetical protein